MGLFKKNAFFAHLEVEKSQTVYRIYEEEKKIKQKKENSNLETSFDFSAYAFTICRSRL
jgi:hypothetical protein